MVSKLSQFSEDFSIAKLNEIYDKSPDALSLNDELNALDLRLKSFNKYFQDTKSHIKSLTHPDVLKYKEWDINEMCKWIGFIDHGRYKKYVDIFKRGFESDGIDCGECLPDLDKNTLRVEPFNIQNFKDRRDLEKHFKSLVSQPIPINDNNNPPNEGAPTAFI